LPKRGFKAKQNEPADFFAAVKVCDATKAQWKSAAGNKKNHVD
jgi:hypothetical protein